MEQVITGFGWGLAGFSLLGAGYAVFAGLLVGRFLRPRADNASSRAVTILKPLHGAEPGLLRNLQSVLQQDYAGPVQIVFGAHDADDPALDAVRTLMAQHPDADIAIVADTTMHGANGKISNLINMLPAARHDVLVMADSDIAVPRSWLSAVVGALEQPGIGAVTCLYAGVAAEAGENVWPRLAAMGTSYDFLPNVVLGRTLGLAEPCFGSTIALTRQTLDRIGGFAAFANTLADDYEIGRAVRDSGAGLAMPALCVTHMASEQGFGELFRHEQRWTRTIRLIDPMGHMGSIVTHGFAFALMGAFLLNYAAPALAGVAATLLARAFLKFRVDAVVGQSTGAYWLLPLRDLLSFAVFVNSLFGDKVHWRGSRYEVAATGAMTQS